MNREKKAAKFLEMEMITKTQFDKIIEYCSLNIFSLHKEIRFFLFLGLMLFASGAGIFIYHNIGSIGHIAILTFILALTVFCFYYSFKRAKGFSNEKVIQQSALLDYAVLAANLLLGIFIAYLQFQYSIFGEYYALATLTPTLIYFFSAYYFDHKGVLSLAISGLFACIGFTLRPKDIFSDKFVNNYTLSYSVIAIAFCLAAFTHYASTKNFKTHFNASYLNFALHLIFIVGISNLGESEWPLFVIILAVALMYFIWQALQQKSLNYMIFSLIYGFIIFNFLIFKIIDEFRLYEALIYLSPFYLVASIFLFRQIIINFKRKIKDASL